MAADEGPDPLQTVLLGGLAVLAGGSLLVVGTGAVAGLVFGRGLPGLGPADAATVLTALPHHLDDPARAWPTPARDVLPGPVGVYVSLAVVGLVVVAVGVVAWRLREVLAPPQSPVRAESRAFATRRDVADLVVRGPEPGRIVLGRVHGRLVASEREHSVLVVGATRSGKTTGYAIPALRDWDGPAVVLSAKTDLIYATHAARSGRGDVLVYDPTGVSGLPTAGWSPLARSGDWRGAVRTANAMSRVSGTTAGLGGSGHWERVAAQLLAPLLLAAATGGLGMGDVVRWVMTKELEEVRWHLLQLGPAGEVALTSLQGYADLEPRARDSAFSTCRTVLDAYEDPDVVTASSFWDIGPERLLDGSSTTVYLLAGASDQARLAPVFLAQLDELLRAAFAAASQRRALHGGPLRLGDGSEAPRLLLLLDEAANIAPIPDLASLASTAGGEGVQLLTIYQDLSQLRHRYGTEWGSIASNHVAKVVLPGITDSETLRYFSQVIGEEDVLVTSTTTGERTSISTAPQRRDVASQRQLRELRRGEGLCLYGHLPPVKVQVVGEPCRSGMPGGPTHRIGSRTTG